MKKNAGCDNNEQQVDRERLTKEQAQAQLWQAARNLLDIALAPSLMATILSGVVRLPLALSSTEPLSLGITFADWLRLRRDLLKSLCKGTPSSCP